MRGVYRAFRLESDGTVSVLDQRLLPFEERYVTLKSAEDTVEAIKSMTVRGAGVIGNIAAFGVYLASKESSGDIEMIEKRAKNIRESRPTAVNLMWAVDRLMEIAYKSDKNERTQRLRDEAIKLCDEEAQMSAKIGSFGADMIEELMQRKGLKRVNVLTHCNAGWLAIVDDGSALAPIYEAKRRGLDIHVWVDETRPRNQGANLTAWELQKCGVPHTVIADNSGGHLMQHNMVDLCITGADRVGLNGDAANKIGTYLKALAAKDNGIPFYVALPSSTFDFTVTDGLSQIPIEIRSEKEVTHIKGLTDKGEVEEVRIVPEGSAAVNYGFDVTPARLITGLITERGICRADKESIKSTFKDII
ncbi:MAG: S-methyl-5-thioribose-1-phosphate isomerase [Hydrogenimonas sp.]|nr:S-methyl-5-thioribose-1-phosphate isomerase [Hydrogenimonas sp.]